MGMTMTQKILAAHAGLDSVSAGQLIEADLDLVLGNDITSPVAIHEIDKMKVEGVFNKDKIALVMDHFAPNKDIKSAEHCKCVREFACKNEITNYFDVGKMGIEHALLPEQGLTVAGDVIIGADSHTCTYGALGAFSTGVGSTDMAAGMATGKAWFKVPSAIKFNIIGKSGDDFSYIPYVERNESIVLSQFTLKEVIRQTIFSIADNDNNKLMTGELFEIEENKLRVVSLDGHRISIRYIEMKNHYDSKKVVVPGKTLQEISKIIPGSADEDVVIYITNNHIVFEFENTTVVSRLIEGEYFKIDQMLSSDYDTKVRINKRELLECIDRATLLVKEGDKKPIIMNITDGNMELRINSFIGSMNEDIDIDKDGKDIMIGFNPKFFIDALRVSDEEEVNLYMVNPKAPCFIKDDEGKFIYLILPVNFNTAAN